MQIRVWSFLEMNLSHNNHSFPPGTLSVEKPSEIIAKDRNWNCATIPKDAPKTKKNFRARVWWLVGASQPLMNFKSRHELARCKYISKPYYHNALGYSFIQVLQSQIFTSTELHLLLSRPDHQWAENRVLFRHLKGALTLTQAPPRNRRFFQDCWIHKKSFQRKLTETETELKKLLLNIWICVNYLFTTRRVEIKLLY